MNVRRRSLTVLLAASLALAPAGTGARPSPREDPVKVECRIAPLRLSRGEEGRVVLTISVRPGLVINSSDLGVEVAEENGRERLSLKKPVEIPFTVDLKAKRDVHVLEGRLRYFVTSVKDGWCLKTSTKFSARFSTRLTVIQKGA
jgi:hypothetical protein